MNWKSIMTYTMPMLISGTISSKTRRTWKFLMDQKMLSNRKGQPQGAYVLVLSRYNESRFDMNILPINNKNNLYNWI